MSASRFILQGLTSRTHLAAIKRLFELPGLDRMICSVAFVNKAGVRLLENELLEFGSKIDFYAGIRNDITSRQGLQALMEAGANVHYVDTGARHLVFHPKLYCAFTSNQARVVIGSANLTPGGLNNNIEASVALDLDVANSGDQALVDQIREGFENLTSEYPDHIVRINSAVELERLQEEGRLLDEAAPSYQRSLARGPVRDGDRIPRIRLKVRPITRPVARARPIDARESAPPHGQPILVPSSAAPTTESESELVWKSKSLTERDLTIPSQAGTHATGSINLDKGLLEAEIDHRHYFREEVFSALEWQPRSETVDEASAEFVLIVKGVNHGTHQLWIRHTNSTDSTAYEQRNAMSRLSWGTAKDFIQRRDLIGRTLSLYRDAARPERFLIEID